MLTLVFIILNGQASTYFQDLLILDTNSQQGLRSAEIYNGLTVLFTLRKIFASSSFSIIGPMWWKKLPYVKKQITLIYSRD